MRKYHAESQMSTNQLSWRPSASYSAIICVPGLANFIVHAILINSIGWITMAMYHGLMGHQSSYRPIEQCFVIQNVFQKSVND